MNKCTSVAGHFNGHGCDMEHIAQCSMTRASPEITGRCPGDCSLHVAPEAARATINTTMMQHITTLLANLKAIVMRRHYTAHIARWRRFGAFIKATKHCHRVSTRSDITNRTHQRRLILSSHHEKGLQLTCWSLIKIGVWHIKLTGTT